LLVHTFGYPADLDPILELARAQNLRVIEDACEAIGAEYGGRKVGSFGDLAVFSFYPNKLITTGEGGVVVTREPNLAQTIRALRNQGRMETDVGGNYRLPDINCALGLAQLNRIESILTRRQEVAERYFGALRAYPDIRPPQMTVADGRISWFVFVIRLSANRDQLAEALTKEGIGCRAYFPPIHLQPLYSAYKNPRQDLSVTEDVASRTLALPFFNKLKDNEIQQVLKHIEDARRMSNDESRPSHSRQKTSSSPSNRR
jgi:perosamine synthetase